MSQEEFVDPVEYQLRTHLDIPDYWEWLEKNGIDPERGRQFLDAVWAATVIDAWPMINHGGERYFKSLAEQLKEADKLTRQLNQLAEANPGFIQPIPPQSRDAEDERVVRAFGSRKDNPGLHLALYLIDDAIRLLGKPAYTAVAIAVSVALSEWVDDVVDPETLRSTRNRPKP